MRPEASRPRIRRLRTGAVAALSALLASLPVRAADLPLQPFQVSHLEVEPGLSHNWVLSIAKDPRGFLWVGTQNGLNRFDGAALKVYRHSPSDARSLPSSVVGALYVDSGAGCGREAPGATREWPSTTARATTSPGFRPARRKAACRARTSG
jgi:hypothetical protein